VFAYSNEEDTVSWGMEQLPPEVVEERTAILADIASRSMERSLERMLGREMEVVVDGVSDEHEFLLSARPLSWAPEIDGEILINDPGGFSLETGKVYEAKITGRAGDRLLATIMGSHGERIHDRKK
jgi:tRNA A37 methylthiotransferase MiaB